MKEKEIEKIRKRLYPYAEFFCECGSEIPRGYGYTLGHKVRCFTCGRINQRKIKCQ